MKRSQAGSGIVEFALVAVLFLTVLLAIMDFGRILFTWNSVAEATRLGARISVVCDKNAERVGQGMQKLVPAIDPATHLEIDWYDQDGINDSCNIDECIGVAVRVKNLTIQPVSPLAWIGFSSLTVPGFSTYLPREIMGQDPDSDTVCD